MLWYWRTLKGFCLSIPTVQINTVRMCDFMNIKIFIFLCSTLGLAILNAQTPADAVKKYVSFFQADSSGDLAAYKNCFAPEERASVKSLPEFDEQTAFKNGRITVLEENAFGLMNEVYFKEELSGICDRLVLKKQDGVWYISYAFTRKLHAELVDDCAEKLENLAQALNAYARKNGGAFPLGNDSAGWQELLNGKFIQDNSETLCPRCNTQYKYLGKRSLDSTPTAPLAYCPNHIHNGTLLNILRVNGKILSGNAQSSKVVDIDKNQLTAVPEKPTILALAFQPSAAPANNFAGINQYTTPAITAPTPAAPAAPAAPSKPEPPPLVLKAPKHWLKGPTPDWYIHLDDAMNAAKRSGKLIYALRTGSDWCPPCKALEKNILSTDTFLNFARNHLILLFVDAPRRKPIPDDQLDYNRQIASQINFGGYVPSLRLLDSDGNVLEEITSRRNTETHINSITELLKKYDKNFETRKITAPGNNAPASGTANQPQTPGNTWITVGSSASGNQPAANASTAEAASKVPDPPADWLKGPDKWFITWEKAAEEAKKRNKKIYALYTGSDWCVWCKKLKKDVLDSGDFTSFAEKNLVLLYIDKPSSRANMPEKQREYNENLSKKLQLRGGYPTAGVFTADGKKLATLGGYSKLDSYIKKLQDAVK